MLIQRPFYYLRHGQTDWNRENRAQGQSDIPLNAHGQAQAEKAVILLRDCPILKICTSPLRRACDTAKIIQSALNVPLQIIDDLKESSWGVCEGQNKGPWFDDWLAGAVPQGAESYNSFIERALGGLNQALANPGPVLIVAHGGTYWGAEHGGRFCHPWDLPNCCPVYHQPPSCAKGLWTRRPIGA